MKILLFFIAIGSIVIGFEPISYADIMNPCEYANMEANNLNQLDTGNDPNFERIKQQNNQELVRACQEYEIKALRNAKSDLDRDNY